MSPLSPVEQKELLATLLSRKMNRTGNTNRCIPTIDITNDDDDDDDDNNDEAGTGLLELSEIDPKELAHTDRVKRAIQMAANGIDNSSLSSEYDRAERRKRYGTDVKSRTGTLKSTEREIQDKMNHFFSIHSNKQKDHYDDDDDDVEISSCSDSEVSDE